MKIVRIILLVLLLAVVAVLGLAATKPDHYHVERSATMTAPPAAVFAQLNDFHRWEAWSPWEKLDPAMKRTMEGPESGRDASYAWVGNDKVGEGRMTIVESEPEARVGIRLEFIKPWTETCQTSFALAPEGIGTRVTWGMDGTRNYVAKIFCVFMDMDKMIGSDFERGLGQLKTLTESAAAGEPAGATATTASTGK
jgi:polyketide cyclase/dehydrase/lipid transport protein